MPFRRLPNTTASVIRTLKTAGQRWKNATGPGDRAISTETWAVINPDEPTSLYSRFVKEAGDVDLALAAQGPLTSATAQKSAQLTLFVSHFHQALDNGILRGTFAPGARAYYGRDIAATTIPDLASYDALVEAAEKIVSGEAARAAAEAGLTFDSGATLDSGLHFDGTHVAMSNPSAAEVGEKLDEFKTLRTQSQAAQRNTNTQQEEAQALYPEAQAKAVDICDEVEFFYRKDPDASSRRAKCAEWGVVYVYEDGTTTPPPAPSAPTP